MRVRQSPAARQDPAEIWTYIANNSGIHRADAIINEIRETFVVFVDYPEIGRLRHEMAPDIRSFSSGNYQIFYRIRHSEIEIARVIHAKRDLSEIF